MKATFFNVLVVRDPNFHIPRQVSGWELPILQEIYGEGAIEVGEEVKRDIPEVDFTSEWARLERVYGVEEESKIPYVAVVYGRSRQGADALQKAVQHYSDTEVQAPRRGPGRPPKAEQPADAA